MEVTCPVFHLEISALNTAAFSNTTTTRTDNTMGTMVNEKTIGKKK
jgi:hypothetical protein